MAAKHHCARHDVSYGALSQCAACVDDPGPAPDDAIAEDPVEFPEGIDDPDTILRALADDLEEMRELRRSIWSKCNRVPTDSHLINSFGKIQDGISKLARILLDAGYLRRDAVLVDRREKRLVKTSRGASH